MQPKKKNLNAYRGVLKNKKLGKILDAGFNAPVGSTKRKHAQRIFSIIQKTHDGAGGPGPSVPKVNMRLAPQTYSYANMVVLGATPKVRVPIGTKAPASYPVHDGAGFSPFGMGGGANSTPSTLNLRPTPTVSPTQNAMTLNLAKGPSTLNKIGGLARGGLSAARASTPVGLASIPGTMMFGSGLKHNYMNMNDRTQTDYGNPSFRTQGSTPQSINYLPKGQTASGNVTKQPVVWGFPGAATADAVQKGTDEQGPSDALKAINNSPTGENNTSINPNNAAGNTPFAGAPGGLGAPGGPVNLTSQFPNVQSAVDNNIGASMFAHQAMMKGADYLRSLPGMQDIPEEILRGGTLAERLQTLDSTLRKQYNLDQLLNNYSDMVKNSGTIRGQMTDYIRGRDEFLNETDGLIGDLKRASMKADMSDPRTQANMTNHMNYLYEMKGRQNKRYVEFLQMSVDEYGSRVTAAENLYKMRYEEYANALAGEQAITTEQYNMMHAGLQEMYQTVADAPFRKLQMEEAQRKMYGVHTATGNDTADYWAQQNGNYAALYKKYEDVNIIDDRGRWVINDSAIYAGQDVRAFTAVMMQAVQQAVLLPVDTEDGTRDPSPGEIQKTIGNALGHMALLLSHEYISPEEYANAEVRLRNLAFQALQKSEFVPAESVDSYRDAINALDGNKPWLWFNSGTPKREEFIKKFGGGGQGLNTEILGSLYDQLQAFLAGDAGRTAEDWVKMKLTSRGELGQGGEVLDNSALRNNLTNNYVNSFRAQTISGNLPPAVRQQQAAGTAGNRPQRNNNPLNIKSGSYTRGAAGITGLDPVPATDGGQFLMFDNPTSGFNAAKQLLTSDLYNTLTVDQALRKWSGRDGYGGNLVPSMSHKIIGQLSAEELDHILHRMAQAEGYYA